MATTSTWIKLGLTSFFWGLMFFLGQHAVGSMTPESIGGWRFLIAALVLVPVVGLRQGIDWPGLRRNVWPLLAMAVIGIGGFNVFLFHGLRLTSPVNGALIMALCPTLITVFGALLTGERIGRRQLAGLALGLVGVAVVVSHGSLRALLSLSLQRGDLYVLFAACCWASYSVIPRRFVDGLAPLQITTGTIGLGGVLISAFAHATQSDFFQVPPASVIAAVLGMSLLGSVLAYLWWNDGVRAIGSDRAAVFMNLVPISAMVIGVALGQPLLPSHLAGAVLVLGGVWFTTHEVAATALPPSTCSQNG